METHAFKPYFVIVGLLVFTSLALALTVDVNISDEAGIDVKLPDWVGAYEGNEIRFCQNGTCRKEWFVRQLEDYDTCPECESKVKHGSIAEIELLPADTVQLKKKYVNSSGNVIHVGIVLSGKERASIHRPQVCLVGQGRQIMDTTYMPVPMEGRTPLKVTVLDLMTTIPRVDGSELKYATYYAYWFVGKDRETPYHVQRMVWMATDRIFRNVSHRWAYISVSGSRTDGSDEYLKVIEDFVRDLYPHMIRDSST